MLQPSENCGNACDFFRVFWNTKNRKIIVNIIWYKKKVGLFLYSKYLNL